jgi:5'-nucleotidase / UDP-sugar diphosphatase
VGGHNHAGFDTALEVDGRLAVKVKSHGRELGRLDLTLDTATGQVTEWRWQAIPVHADRYPADPDVQALVDAWESRVRAVVDVPIATALRTLSGDRLRRLLQDALAEETGADIAYLNPGGIRSSLPQGTILKRHVWNVLPFDNEVVIATVRGTNLPAVVRADARIDPARTYRFATIDFLAETSFARSGIAFEYTGRPMRDLAIDWIERRGRLE